MDNGLRHSFISYRLANIKNMGQVALEAGNPAGMIFKHYRQVVTEAQAREWFAIVTPEGYGATSAGSCSSHTPPSNPAKN